ncbi:MAG: LolA family protein, partial [Terriglobia bacterium]
PHRLLFIIAVVELAMGMAIHPAFGAPVKGSPVSIEEYVRRFESSYHELRSLEADFTQSYFAWGNRRIESGKVYLAPSGKMRWVYDQPEAKIFLSDGKQIFFYVPSEKQLTISSLHGAQDARVPLDILLSHLPLNRVFSRVEFADQALKPQRGDRVICGYPKAKYSKDYRSCLIELTPGFDVRRLVIFYPDNSTMQFTFRNIERNKPLDPALFAFTPPPGTEIIHR